MGELRLSGLSTGIDTTTLVKQLMAIEQKRLNLYKTRQETYTERKEALSELKTKLEALQNATEKLSNSGDLRAYRTASSDEDVLTAEASSTAHEGSHSVTVSQLASAERWVHSGGLEYAESLVGAGTFIYSYNNEEMVITTTEETTLEDLVGLINNDANNPGVTASLLSYNDAYHLVFNGNDAGSDYEIKINTSNTEVWQAGSPLSVGTENASLSDRIRSLDQFSGVLAGDESITISGTKHDGTAVNFSMDVNEHTTLNHLIGEINDAFGDSATATLVNGQIRLTSSTNGTSQMTLNLTYNAGSGSTTLDLPTVSQSTAGGSISASLAGFAAGDFIETQSAQDSRIKVDGFPVGADEWITRSSNTIDDVISGVTLHLLDTGTVQVSLTRDTESVKTKLATYLEAYNEVVSFLDKNTSYDAETKKAGVLMSDLTMSSLLNNLRGSLVRQTKGFVIDVDSFLMPGQIGLKLDSDGLLSLDSDVFDKAISKNYLGVLALIGANKTGSSDSNTVKMYGASSRNTTAGTYNVQVTVAGGAITSAKIKLADETTWRDATIGGNMIIGDSTFDEYNVAMYPENGLQLSVDLSNDGTYAATVRVKQGFTGAMEDALDSILNKTTGMLALDQDQVQDQIDHLQDAIDREEERLEGVETRLIAKYARLEKMLTLLQNQFAGLSSLSS
ncbi:MAG TPA: flagellar filament capping protein FliD [Sedimentisphaerales bacterium]|jgi:flagellar hook-associated protein 2|nr:flagellar filament capping protein FliD [Sedimentisphaerales bacterium]HNU27742.1 flagellar filament capping protein FliD [Sedimentisphaerales bacterium]